MSRGVASRPTSDLPEAPRLWRTHPPEAGLVPDEDARLTEQLALLPAAVAAAVRGAVDLPCTPAGQPSVRRHRTLYPLPLSPERVAEARTGCEGPPALVYRVGLGELVDAALVDRPADAAPLMVWEPDPAVLRAALTARDWRQPLAEGRLVLVLGVDLLDHPALVGAPRWLHPVLTPHAPWVLDALRQGFDRPRAVVRDGGLLVHELAQRLGAAGLQPWVLDVDRLGQVRATHALRRLAPRVVLGVNHMSGLPELCARLGLPLVEWEIDPSIERLAARKGPVTTTTIATWRRRNLDAYAQAGFPRVVHLPLAADTTLRRPTPLAPGASEHPRAPVTFVGNSLVTMAASHGRAAQRILARFLTAQGDRTRAEVLVQALLQMQRQRLATWLLPKLLAGRFPGLDAWLRREGELAHPALLLGEVIGAEWRLNAVAACAGVGVEVWGDDGWQSAQRPRVSLRGPAGARQQLTKIYANAVINLDISRAYQRDIVTLRVFDVLACGGFVLAEHSEELADCFVPGDEVAVWRGLSDLRAKVRHYLDHPDERRRIADRGRARVLRDHRLRDRVARLLELSTGAPTSTPGSTP